nr:hypothetical protein B0A51_09022 [Rachicladosporium sp. CCFEE 5018]
MASTAKGWTEAEKLGLLFQIIARSGTIPWPELELPAGRTVKACQVMIDKEKKKVKDTMAERAQKKGDYGEQGEGEKSVSPKVLISFMLFSNLAIDDPDHCQQKRKATTDENGGKAKRGKKAKKADEDGDGDGEQTTTPKPKKGRGKKAVSPKVEPQCDDDNGALEAAEEAEAEAEAEDEGAED